MTGLEKEFEFYRTHQDEMVAKYDGLVIAIKAGKVIGAYPSHGEALREAAKEHEVGTFLLQKVSHGDKDYTVYYYSPRVNVLNS